MWLSTKVTKYQAVNGAYKRSVSLIVPDFCIDYYIFIVPTISQIIRKPLRSDLVLSDEQKMCIESKFFSQD